MTCDRCEELEEKIAWLESELGLRNDAERTERFRKQYRLTPYEAALMMRLYRAKGHVVTIAQLEEAIPPIDETRERNFEILRVYFSRIKVKLGTGKVENVWGAGYKITAEGMALVASVIAGPEAVLRVVMGPDAA